MTLCVAVSLCSRCKKPALGYLREIKALSQAEIEKKTFMVVDEVWVASCSGGFSSNDTRRQSTLSSYLSNVGQAAPSLTCPL